MAFDTLPTCMADDRNWKDLFGSWSNPGSFAHPDSPVGGCGPGFSRPPGPLGVGDRWPLIVSVPHPDSPVARHFAWATGLPTSIAGLTHRQKMAKAIQSAYDRGLISDEFMKRLPSVEELALGIVVVGGVLIGLGVAAGALASTGVGAVLEGIAAAIVLALAAIGIIASAAKMMAGIVVLMKFYYATESARSDLELDAAGSDFAKGLAEVGVGSTMMILSVVGAWKGYKMAKGLKRDVPPPSRPILPRPALRTFGPFRHYTDSLGRPVVAEGPLQSTGALRNPAAQTAVSGPFNDVEGNIVHASHLIPRRFGGSPEGYNLVPLPKNFNLGPVSDFENELAAALRAGENLFLRVEADYIGTENIPKNLIYRIFRNFNGQPGNEIIKERTFYTLHS